jgi:hypothetical protein
MSLNLSIKQMYLNPASVPVDYGCVIISAFSLFYLSGLILVDFFGTGNVSRKIFDGLRLIVPTVSSDT